MAVQTPLERPYFVEGGHADFMLKSDMLRNTPGALRTMMETYNQPVTMLEILDSIGRSNMVSKSHSVPTADFYFQHDDDRYFAIGSVVTAQTGPGAPVTVALAASEMKLQDGRRFSRPRKSETVIAKDRSEWKIINKIINTGSAPHQLVLQPALTTQTGTFAANDRFAILAPRFAEATGQPKGLVRDYGLYSNRFTITKENDLTSGTNMTTNQTVLYAVPDLKNYAYIQGIEEAEMRHELNKSKAAIFSTLNDGNILDYSPDFDTEIADLGTEGMLQSIENQGVIQTYDTAAGYDLADFRRAESRLRQMRFNGGDIAVIQGGSIASAVQSVLIDYAGKDAIGKYFSDKYLKQRYKAGEQFSPEGYFLQMGFNGIGFGNYKFLFREATELNNMFGDDGYTGGEDFSGYQFFLPMNTFRDAKSKAAMPGFQMLHRGQDAGGYQRLNEIWQTGGAGPIQKTDEWDVMRTHIRSEWCFMLYAGKFSIVQKPGTADA